MRAELCGRIDALDAKVVREELAKRIEAVQADVAGRIESLRKQDSRYLTCTIGIQVAVLLAVIAPLSSR